MRKVKELCNQWFAFDSWEKRCDALNIPYIKEPQNDNERLINYQHDFLYSELKDTKSEAMLWILSEKICNNLIKKEMKLNNLVFDAETREEKAGIATDYVCRRWKQYLNYKNEIYVIRNFVFQLNKAVEHALWHEEENDFTLDSSADFEQVENFIVPGVIEQHEDEEQKKKDEQLQAELIAHEDAVAAENFVLVSDSDVKKE